ncbi:MAG: hypothetical protein ACXVYV_02360 [Gaiellales bacterium]
MNAEAVFLVVAVIWAGSWVVLIGTAWLARGKGRNGGLRALRLMFGEDFLSLTGRIAAQLRALQRTPRGGDAYRTAVAEYQRLAADAAVLLPSIEELFGSDSPSAQGARDLLERLTAYGLRCAAVAETDEQEALPYLEISQIDEWEVRLGLQRSGLAQAMWRAIDGAQPREEPSLSGAGTTARSRHSLRPHLGRRTQAL